MDKPEIEEQIRVIESAIKLSQSRNLPAIKPNYESTSLESTERPETSRDVALFILKKVDEKMTNLEKGEILLQQHQVQLESAQDEHREAIELITGELAELKKRTKTMERSLRQQRALNAPKPKSSRNPYLGRPARRLKTSVIIAFLIMTIIAGSALLILLLRILPKAP